MNRSFRLFSARKFAAASVVALGAHSQALQAKGDAVKQFSSDGSKYDKETFNGRVLTMLDVIDPRFLMWNGAKLEAAKKKIEDFKNGDRSASDEELWEARAGIESMTHPVTGETTFALGRMSAFVPLNVPICVGMLAAGSPASTLFMQWINQSYNVLCNYTNRSSDSVEWGPLLQAYGLAVTVAGSIAVGMSTLVKSVPALQSLGLAVPYMAVVSAGSANLYFTRKSEIDQGVPVTDADGNVMGTSKLAGYQAVKQTILSRCVCLPILPMLIPPFTMAALSGIFNTKMKKMAGETVLVAIAFSFGLPCALAILPEKMEVQAKDLEEQFHNMKDSKGETIVVFFANKGR